MTNWQDTLKRILAIHKMKRADGRQTHPTPAKMSGQETGVPTAVHALDDAALVKLMRCLSMTEANACTCNEAFAMLDQYTELVASDEQAIQLMPLVKNHIDICPDCREEFETLLRIVHAEQSEEPS
jgi:hypothetical protein